MLGEVLLSTYILFESRLDHFSKLTAQTSEHAMYPMACSDKLKLHILQPIFKGLSGNADGIPDANGGEVIFFDKPIGSGKTDIENRCNVGHGVSPTFLLRVFLFVTHK